MANIIQIKRSTGSDAPSGLQAGELAYSGGAGTQSNGGQRLFIGDPSTGNNKLTGSFEKTKLKGNTFVTCFTM